MAHPSGRCAPWGVLCCFGGARRPTSLGGLSSHIKFGSCYHWLHDGIMDPVSEHYDRIIAGKEPYLNATFFIVRTIIYLLIWNYFAKKLRRLSILEDANGGTSYHNSGVKTSAWFMVFFAVTSAMASWERDNYWSIFCYLGS